MIEVIEKIDAIEEKEDGRVNLIIFYNEQIDNSIETQERLMDKVEFYLDMIKTDGFKQKYSRFGKIIAKENVFDKIKAL